MRHWVIILVVLLVAFIAIGYLHDQGYINFEWQWLAIAFGALAGPYKFLKNAMFGSSGVDKVLEKNQQGRIEDQQHREKMDKEIEEKERRIQNMNKEIELLDAKLQVVEERKKKIPDDVKKMSVDETKQEFTDLFGS